MTTSSVCRGSRRARRARPGGCGGRCRGWSWRGVYGRRCAAGSDGRRDRGHRAPAGADRRAVGPAGAAKARRRRDDGRRSTGRRRRGRTERKDRMGSMAFEVDDVEHRRASRPGCRGPSSRRWSPASAEAGDAGLAQALALAAEERSFADARRRRPLDAAWTTPWPCSPPPPWSPGTPPSPCTSARSCCGPATAPTLADRLARSTPSRTPFRHVGAVVDQFEGATDAVALEVGPGRALVAGVADDGAAATPTCAS